MAAKKIITSRRRMEQSRMTVPHDQPSSPPESLSQLYDAIGPEKAEAAKKVADAIKERENSSVFDSGDALIKTKDELPHGKFQPWVKLALGWDIRDAQCRMATARRLGAHRATLSSLQTSALHAMAQRGVPEKALESLLSRAARGDDIKKHDVEEEVRAAKTASLESPEDTPSRSTRAASMRRVPKRGNSGADDDEHGATVCKPVPHAQGTLKLGGTSGSDSAEPDMPMPVIPEQAIPVQENPSVAENDREALAPAAGAERDFWHARLEPQIRAVIQAHPQWFVFTDENDKRAFINELAKRIVGQVVAAQREPQTANVVAEGQAGLPAAELRVMHSTEHS